MVPSPFGWERVKENSAGFPSHEGRGFRLRGLILSLFLGPIWIPLRGITDQE